ncbi:MAG: hypothetical protein LBH06_01060, partial [Rikenellaceae bacterium]|nr:hypothetical protein [Rikenellaceae bacterium]
MFFLLGSATAATTEKRTGSPEVWHSPKWANLKFDFNGNAGALGRVDREIEEYRRHGRLDSIVVNSFAPQGNDPQYNIRLLKDRAEALRSYIIWRFPDIDRRRISLFYGVADTTAHHNTTVMVYGEFFGSSDKP